MTSRCPCAFSYQPWIGFVIPVVCVGVTDKWWQKCPFSVIMPDQRGARRRVAWTMPLPEVPTAPWHPDAQPSTLAALAPMISQGKGDWDPGKKGKPRVPHGKVHSGGRTVCPEENSLAVDAKHVCTRMVFRIQTEHCLFVSTLVKSLFVPSPNPRVYWS